MKKNYFTSVRFIITIAVLLVMFFTLSLSSEIKRIKQQYRQLALYTAESYFNTIVMVRKWNALHNGVYVPVTEGVQPNPYLEDPLRDLETTSGMKLTKVNPAFMTRLISKMGNVDESMRFHITSLKPINPANKPDPWEQAALMSLEAGAGVKHEIIESENKRDSYFRYMAPLKVEQPCLQCHAKQGYQVGDILGGISVTFPYKPYQIAQASDVRASIFTHLVFLGVLATTILFFGRKSISAEKELRMLSQAVEQSPNSIVITDVHGDIVYVNPKFAQITGYRAEEVLKQNPRILKSGHQPDEFYRELWETISQGDEWRGEFHNRKKNGELFWEQATIAPVRDRSGKITNFIAIKEDITQLKEEQAERKRLIKELERSNKELENFAYVASHDLREPLRKISAFGQILKDSLANRLNADEEENLGFMIDGARRLQQMIDDLLSYSRLTTQAKPSQVIDLNELVADLRDNALYAKLVDTGGKIEIPDPLPQVYADATQVRQLMQNLVDNALKYRREDTTPEIIISAKTAKDNFVRVEVADNGIGIDERYFEVIFTMFKRLHGRGQYEGTGLGLAICKKIVERHGGSIGVYSVPGQGSTFWFTLPLPPGSI
jgi:PAS domain S-box-containing protein